MSEKIDVGLIGGGGMIGSNVVKRLLEGGYSVAIFDNFSTYPFSTLDQFDIPLVELTIGDVKDKYAIDNFISKCERIVHLTSLTDVGLSIKNPQECFDIDIIGGQNIISSCQKHKIKKIVFASSASVYGNPSWLNGMPPKVKENEAICPLSNYANGKFFIETQLRMYNDFYGLPSTSLRYFSVWGIPQTPKEGSHSWNIAIWVMRAMKGKSMKVFGDGMQVRDYTHISDITEATVQCLFNPKTDGKVFNVGTGIPTTVLEVAQEIQKYFPESKIEFTEKVKGDPLGCCADNSLMKELLGWVPTLKIEDKLEEYINWVKENPERVPTWV